MFTPTFSGIPCAKSAIFAELNVNSFGSQFQPITKINMEFSSRDSMRLVRTDRMSMRWGEMDSLAHMNNVAYLRYFEESRVAWFSELEIDYDSRSEGPILGTISCRYVKSAIYPVTFLVTSYVGRLGKSSFVMNHQLTNFKDESEIYAEAEAVLVWADINAGKSRPVPNWFRKVIQGE